jgi:hypothetical protein
MNILKKLGIITISSFVILTSSNLEIISYASKESNETISWLDFSGLDSKRRNNSESNYSTIKNYIEDIGNIYYNQRIRRYSSYFSYDDKIYNILEDNKIAKLFPANFKPDEKTWVKKADYTSKKVDLAESLASEIKYKRRTTNYKYFKQSIVNSMLSKYFPNIYKESYNDTKKLENFLYYFGIVDAYYAQNTNGNIDEFLFNYAEPMYNMLDLYDIGTYSDTDINAMRNNLQGVKITTKEVDKKTKEENDYYKDRNLKVKNERK